MIKNIILTLTFLFFEKIATAKEQIGLEILEAQIEAIDNNEELEESEVQEIVAKYGELQADGDTIILNDGGYEVSLREIYNEMAEAETDGDSTTELAQLKALLAQTTVTEDKILKDYKAYKDGQLITGTMENYAGKTVSASTITESGENALITIPQNGYYSTSSKISVPVSEISSNLSKAELVTDSYDTSYNNWTNVNLGFQPEFLYLTNGQSQGTILISVAELDKQYGSSAGFYIILTETGFKTYRQYNDNLNITYYAGRYS